MILIFVRVAKQKIIPHFQCPLSRAYWLNKCAFVNNIVNLIHPTEVKAKERTKKRKQIQKNNENHDYKKKKNKTKQNKQPQRKTQFINVCMQSLRKTSITLFVSLTIDKRVYAVIKKDRYHAVCILDN